ncbi:MAG: hypothetical protein GOMPHAMPRED_006385 [Gomphillus americanus]|uniref:Uncharacterized protein n=1 Tax=Gomphillus americanus TaxID=1940652 RepID=A0A8H3G252_9LECA|nr:MAG: hypothetical protein GOMPHAMPRED_006385 [Gomphillus americanus]
MAGTELKAASIDQGWRAIIIDPAGAGLRMDTQSAVRKDGSVQTICYVFTRAQVRNRFRTPLFNEDFVRIRRLRAEIVLNSVWIMISRLTRIPDHNNGTAIKNCGNGSGCCHTDVNQDCRYSVGSARALLLEAQSVVSYTAEPSSPVTLWLSGTAVSVSTPSPVVRSTFTTGVTVTSTSTYTTERVSVSSMRTRSTRSNTITPVPTIHNLIAVSTAVPVEVTAIPSSSATAINSSEISNLGLMIGLPIGIPIVLTFLIVAFFLFRRYVREDKANQHEVDAPAGCQWSQDKERFEDQKWDYKTITTRKYSPNPRFSICNKPLPIPKLRASRETLSVPFVMYELPGDDWLAKELPGSPDPSWEQRKLLHYCLLDVPNSQFINEDPEGTLSLYDLKRTLATLTQQDAKIFSDRELSASALLIVNHPKKQQKNYEQAVSMISVFLYGDKARSNP